MDKKGICVDRIYLYHTLCKAPIKKEKKRPFLIKKNLITNGAKQEYIYKKIKTTARV